VKRRTLLLSAVSLRGGDQGGIALSTSEPSELQSETNEYLVDLLEHSAKQSRYLEKIHFWVRFLGAVTLIGIRWRIAARRVGSIGLRTRG